MNPIIKQIQRVGSVLLSAAMLGSAALQASAADLNAALNDPKWNAFVQEAIDADNPPGMALCVVSGSDVAYKNWGYGDVAAQIPVTENTVFEIGSCSKAFTALSVLLLQEEGRLSIDDSVSDYIPWWHVTWQGEDADVKIWMLLNHCAGIPNGQTMAKAPFGTDPAQTEETARIAEDLALVHAPGDTYEYCNLDYAILAYLTETVSGVQFSDFVTQEIFQPLGMTHSGYDIPTTQGYQYFFGKTVAYNAPRMKGSEGDGYAITTAADMSRWMQAQMGLLDIPEPLANAIAASQEVLPEHTPHNPAEDCYYNGWIHLEQDRNMIMHSGMNPNFTAMVLIDPAKETAVFAVNNIGSNANSYAAYALFADLTGRKDGYPQIERFVFNDFDRIVAIGSGISALLLLFVIIMLLTQKKRLADKQTTPRKETVLLIVRLSLLVVLLAAAVGLPYLLGMLMGYPGFGYTMIAYWAPHSIFVLCGILDAILLCLIVLSVKRFIIQKK